MQLLKHIALTIKGRNILEKILCYFSSNSWVRNKFKIGAIPNAYTSILDKPEIRIAKIGNYRFYVNIAEYSGISLFFFGEHNEPFSAWLVSELVNQGDICIDIGANAGSYTALMASSAGSKGKVFAFEPQPNLHNLLWDSVKLNQADNFISIDGRALYSKSGEKLKFYLSENPNNSGTSSLVNHGVFVHKDYYIVVETVTLSDYFRTNAIERCKLIKIDVERAELEVIRGMVDLLREQRIDYIVLEQLASSEAQKLLHSFGYMGWLIDEKKRVLVDINTVEYGTFANYLFVTLNCINEFKHHYAILLKTISPEL